MNLIEVAVVAFVFGAIGGLAPGWRTWRDVLLDLRWHGFDNHLCNRPTCCPKPRV